VPLAEQQRTAREALGGALTACREILGA
jgi:hypothetical protein